MPVLFPILTVYTLVYLGLMIYDFVTKELFNMPAGMMVIYVALVGAYAADKEIRRWMGKEDESRKGVYFVYAWLVFYLVAFLIYSFKREFTIPPDLHAVALQVLGIFFGSKLSKKIHEQKMEQIYQSREEKVIDLLKEKGEIQRKELDVVLNVSDTTAYRILEQMEKKGLIVQVGQYKNTVYRLKEA